MRIRFALLLLAALPSSVSAQNDADDLQSTFRALTRQWARGDASAVLRHMTPEGLSIDLSEGPMGPLGERQAAALLRRLFDEGETVEIVAGMLQQVGGRPPRAFGAITWITRPKGTQVPVRRTVYFGLEWNRERWKVAEIRLIP